MQWRTYNGYRTFYLVRRMMNFNISPCKVHTLWRTLDDRLDHKGKRGMHGLKQYIIQKQSHQQSLHKCDNLNWALVQYFSHLSLCLKLVSLRNWDFMPAFGC
eukprot:101874-Amphidinium_carterae.1